MTNEVDRDISDKAIINELKFQRNNAQDMIAVLAGEIAARDDIISKLKKELQDLKTNIDKPDPPSNAISSASNSQITRDKLGIRSLK